MRAAFIWFIEDLIFPGDTAKIGNCQIRKADKENEYDDGSHGNDFIPESATNFSRLAASTLIKYRLALPKNRKRLDQIHIEHGLDRGKKFARVPDQT